MRPLSEINPKLRTYLGVFLPLILWGALWLSLSPGQFENIYSPNSPTSFFNGLRSAFPFVTLFLGLVLIIYKLSQRVSGGIHISNPLAMMTVYGLIGLVATLNSPDVGIAFRWALLYLSVPVVLWAIVWGSDASIILARLINITWVVIAVASVVLFFIALTKLSFIDRIMEPSLLLECGSGGWYDMTSGKLRDTGVGRYAAIASLISISGLWQPRWRLLAAVILIFSVTLLLFSGARGAFAGFTVGAVLMIALYGGKKSMLIMAVVAVLFIISLLGTSTGEKFLDMCLVRSTTPSSQIPSSLESQPLRIPEQSSTQPPRSSVTGQLPLSQFFEFTGRTAVWKEGIRMVGDSPAIGYGFHADRLKLGTHMHNSIMQSLIQAGILGMIAFVIAIALGWFQVIKISQNLNQLLPIHKHLAIQSISVLGFFSLRSFPESTGAFFGVDLLILCTILLFIHVLSRMPKVEIPGSN